MDRQAHRRTTGASVWKMTVRSPVREPAPRGHILVVATSRDDAFTALFFEGLPPDVHRRIRVLEFGNDSLALALAGATAVVLMRRGLFDYGSLRACAAFLRIPRYYFLDDNFIIVREEPENYGPFWSEYTLEGVREALKGFAGVLLASRPLLEYFAAHELHPRLSEYPPIAWPVIRRRDGESPAGTEEPFRIAFFGGGYRRDVFASFVYPAIQRLACRQKIELVVSGIGPAALAPDSHVRIVHLPHDVRYGAALGELARHRIDVLVHPTPPTRNNPYKNANVLINARAVGAVPVLSDMPPYDALGSPAPAILCENDPEAWYGALARLARDGRLRDQVFERTARYCDEHFSGAANAEAIRVILASHAAPGRWSRAARRVVAAAPLGADRARWLLRQRLSRNRLLRSAYRYLKRGG